MSHFEQEKTQAPNLPHQGIVINWDNALDFALIAFLILSVLTVFYLLITRCNTYWRARLEDWGRQLVESDKNK